MFYKINWAPKISNSGFIERDAMMHTFSRKNCMCLFYYDCLNFYILGQLHCDSSMSIFCIGHISENYFLFSLEDFYDDFKIIDLVGDRQHCMTEIGTVMRMISRIGTMTLQPWQIT